MIHDRLGNKCGGGVLFFWDSIDARSGIFVEMRYPTTLLGWKLSSPEGHDAVPLTVEDLLTIL